MFIELVDALRCPHQHEESWLVVATSLTEHRHVVGGTLGCPVCKAEFPVRGGVVDFRAAHAPPSPSAIELRDDDGMRLAALLDLSDATGFAVLVGGWGAKANALTELVETPLLLVDPPEATTGSPGISVIRTDVGIPIASSAARGTAVDDPARVAEAARITRVKGRLLAPVQAEIPDGFRELARDERLWVAERQTVSSPPVTLHVRRALG